MTSLIRFSALHFGNEVAERAGAATLMHTLESLAGGDDYTASTATTGVVNVGGCGHRQHRVDAGDDWFRITLTAGRTYQFDLEASASGQGTLADPFLELMYSELMYSAGSRTAFDFVARTGNNVAAGGRDPNAYFDTSGYLGTYGDIAAANIDPLAHFLRFGAYEGRSPFADGVIG